MRPLLKISACLFIALLATKTQGLAQTQTNFNFGGNLTSSYGPGSLSYWNGTNTSNTVTFNTTSGYGITALPDNAAGNRTVMSIPAFNITQGFEFAPNLAANGGGARINQYTFGFDLFITSRTNWFAFYQTEPLNNNDGDFFARPAGDGDGIGISGNYQGTISANTWHRVMVTVDLAAAQPTMTKFIDGTQVGQHVLSSGVDGRWSLGANTSPTLIFADEDGETSPAFVSSLYFANAALTPVDVQGLGGVKVIGFIPVPEPTTILAMSAAGAAAWFRRRRKQG